ncbi:hypothetical protein D9611_000736 [Ephemerocybe angulata]|uniref:Protein kinase domain-containing protein n=1 Tax=Ephemerocybe angulata TaxID=980116 RepID=A0A8H5BMT3_9AGAR|nr:hypothetical protein D9611_000736 [Tulosesus angulatus]
MSISSDDDELFFEKRQPPEIFWRDHYDWLLESGYRLRPRFKPDWVPGWKTNPKLDFSQCEDSSVNMRGVVCDAIRLEDNSQVVLKKVDRDHQSELEVHSFLTEIPESKNHTIPIIENRDWDFPDFDIVGEVVDFIGQILEGFKFMHDNLIAHRDIKSQNILMDASALSKKHFHLFRPYASLDFKKTVTPTKTRTEGRPRYYIIDFGLSRRYDGSKNPPYEITPMYGTDITVPEFQNLEKAHNPFPVDVYCLGNMIKNRVLGRVGADLGFQWLMPLLDDMTKEKPEDRPTMDAILTRFSELTRGLKEWKLRSKFRLDWDDLAWYDQTATIIPHWWRKLRFTVARTPAIPTFKPESESKRQEASKDKTYQL